jgi:hypothetical protein
MEAINWSEGGHVMSQIVLTDEQMQIIDRATEPVEILSPKGRRLASVAPAWTAEEIADAKRRLQSGTWYSSEEVQKYMRLLEEEVARTGQCDEARAAELIKQLKPWE